MFDLEDSPEWVSYRAGQQLPIFIKQDFSKQPHWSVLFQTQVSRALTGKTKRHDWIEAKLGYDISDLRAHLQRQFIKGMNWQNYAGNRPFGARNVWHVDHVHPKSLFSEDEVRSCFALTNLRPIWASDNMRKGARRSLLL